MAFQSPTWAPVAPGGPSGRVVAVSKADVNQIGLLTVPWATSVPFTIRPDDAPRVKFTTTPGSMVRVTPDTTCTAPETVTGLCASVQFVFVVISELTLIACGLNASGRTPVEVGARKDAPSEAATTSVTLSL